MVALAGKADLRENPVVLRISPGIIKERNSSEQAYPLH
jgi:hypothetical protein